VTIVAFVFVLSLLVFVHELGHFLAAKRAHIEVEEFGFGYPPRLLTLGRRGGTEYTLNAIPFGGFVRMVGEDNPSVPGSLASKPKRTRLMVLGAGAGMNLLLAFVLFASTFMLGVPVPVEYERVMVTDVVADSPAVKAGLQEGDFILAADGQAIQSPEALSTYTSDHLGQQITLEVQREGETLNIAVVPRQEWPESEGPMGVVIQPYASKVEVRTYPWWQSLWLGLRETLYTMGVTLLIPVLVLRGMVPASAVRPVGPIGVAQLTSDAAQQVIASGWWFPLLQLTAVVSAGLCLANLLPIPGLDGGRIFFVIVEAIRGRPIDPDKERLFHVIGMVLIIVLMLVVTYQDVASPVPSVNWGDLPRSTP
jgi:regulator of sigma E protease